MFRWPRMVWTAVALGLLALAAYGRSLGYPFISDDYIQILFGQEFTGNWSKLAADPLYRCRASSLLLTAATEKLFGLQPVAYHLTSVLLHVVNALLVLGFLRGLGCRREVALAAAAFFTVYESHQEAVIWYAAVPEQLMLAFSLGSLILWRRWRDQLARSGLCYAASLLLFVIGLFSKESAVLVAPLLLWMAWWQSGRVTRRDLWAAAPFAALAVVYTVVIFVARDRHLFFHDGTFTPGFRFLLVLPHSLGRMMMWWGAAAVLIVGWTRTLRFSLAWMAIVLLPYSFLTYMDRVPSRHRYFAAVGLSLLIGEALWSLWQRWGARRPWLVPALASMVAVQNCAYLWTRKHQQYLERAAPTEQLIAHIRSHRGHRGRTWVLKFPYGEMIAHSAVSLMTERDPRMILVADQADDPGAHKLEWDPRAVRYIID